MITVDDIVRIMKHAGIARGKSDLANDEPLDEQGLDSYDRMSLLFELEQNLDVELPTEVANRLKTLNDIVDYVNEQD